MSTITNSILDKYGFTTKNGITKATINGDNFIVEIFINGEDMRLEYTDFDNGEIFNPESASIHLSDLSETDLKEIEQNYNNYVQNYDLTTTWNNGRITVERFLKNFDCHVQFSHIHTYKTVGFTIRQISPRDLNNIFENTQAVIRVMSYFL